LNLVKYCLYNSIIQVAVNVIAVMALVYFSVVSFKLVVTITSAAFLLAAVYLMIRFKYFIRHSENNFQHTGHRE